MPHLRGIEVSLTTKPENEKIPEYPHPEGVSARLLGTLSSRPNGQSIPPKAGPTVAVYIPSIPRTPFAINYGINNVPPAPCKYIFFRLYMNGRPIAAWGVDPNDRPKGKVVKSLWAPYEFDQVGFEGLNFVFLPGQEHKPVAEDGGLIEIQVFRAKERRARVPRLEEFRFHENYGIAAPSIGLLDQPQDACFYDWHLLDAKDAPFATFRLHYRSWRSLKQLNLVPATELEILCSASPKALKAIIKAENDSELLDDASTEEQSSQSGNSDEAVFHDCNEEPNEGGEQDDDDEDTAYYFLKSPPELFSAVSSSLGVPQPSKALRDAYRASYLQRPLPELPIEEPDRLSRRSSVASAGSAALSITPSLLQYVDEEFLNPEEIEVGVAQLVQLPPSESTLDLVSDEEPNPADHSISDYETSPKSNRDSFLAGMLSPGRYLPMTGSGLERGIALFASPKKSIFSKTQNFRQSLPGNFHSKQPLSPLERMTSSESEWMVRSPSSGQATAANDATRGDCSPQKGKGSGMSLFAGLRKKRINGSPGKLPGMAGRDVSKPGDGGNIIQRAMGNWIR
ncbi:hypothetical protein C8A00DRAFT_29423 [Chaetomidium leptoderma]|uniref:Uncharacterized protein n=1 Tax=Chaetomidium leptoderma TaxID=669021 RepID=A0AAN6ZZB7_9PEZI|nr:hypothetical protein C8A00DRAFT_29423 [Chaetomidium leptoderma]